MSNRNLDPIQTAMQLTSILINHLDTITESYFCDDFTTYADTINSLETTDRKAKDIRLALDQLAKQYREEQERTKNGINYEY